jgi:hypothetical protein
MEADPHRQLLLLLEQHANEDGDVQPAKYTNWAQQNLKDQKPVTKPSGLVSDVPAAAAPIRRQIIESTDLDTLLQCVAFPPLLIAGGNHLRAPGRGAAGKLGGAQNHDRAKERVLVMEAKRAKNAEQNKRLQMFERLKAVQNITLPVRPQTAPSRRPHSARVRQSAEVMKLNADSADRAEDQEGCKQNVTVRVPYVIQPIEARGLPTRNANYKLGTPRPCTGRLSSSPFVPEPLAVGGHNFLGLSQHFPMNSGGAGRAGGKGGGVGGGGGGGEGLWGASNGANGPRELATASGNVFKNAHPRKQEGASTQVRELRERLRSSYCAEAQNEEAGGFWDEDEAGGEGQGREGREGSEGSEGRESEGRAVQAPGPDNMIGLQTKNNSKLQVTDNEKQKRGKGAVEGIERRGGGWGGAEREGVERDQLVDSGERKRESARERGGEEALLLRLALVEVARQRDAETQRAQQLQAQVAFVMQLLALQQARNVDAHAADSILARMQSALEAYALARESSGEGAGGGGGGGGEGGREEGGGEGGGGGGKEEAELQQRQRRPRAQRLRMCRKVYTWWAHCVGTSYSFCNTCPPTVYRHC